MFYSGWACWGILNLKVAPDDAQLAHIRILEWSSKSGALDENRTRDLFFTKNHDLSSKRVDLLGICWGNMRSMDTTQVQTVIKSPLQLVIDRADKSGFVPLATDCGLSALICHIAAERYILITANCDIPDTLATPCTVVLCNADGDAIRTYEAQDVDAAIYIAAMVSA